MDLLDGQSLTVQGSLPQSKSAATQIVGCRRLTLWPCRSAPLHGKAQPLLPTAGWRRTLRRGVDWASLGGRLDGRLRHPSPGVQKRAERDACASSITQVGLLQLIKAYLWGTTSASSYQWTGHLTL